MSQLIPSLLAKHGREATIRYIHRRYLRMMVGLNGRAVQLSMTDRDGLVVVNAQGDLVHVPIDHPGLDLDTRYPGYYPSDTYGLVYLTAPGRSMFLGLHPGKAISARTQPGERHPSPDCPISNLTRDVGPWIAGDIVLRPEFRKPPIGKYAHDVEIFHPQYARVGDRMWGPGFLPLGRLGDPDDMVTDPVALHYLKRGADT